MSMMKSNATPVLVLLCALGVSSPALAQDAAKDALPSKAGGLLPSPLGILPKPGNLPLPVFPGSYPRPGVTSPLGVQPVNGIEPLPGIQPLNGIEPPYRPRPATYPSPFGVRPLLDPPGLRPLLGTPPVKPPVIDPTALGAYDR